MLLQQIQSFMQGDLLDGQPADYREHVQFETAQDVVVALLVLLAAGLVPLPKQRLDRVGLDDGLLFQKPHDLRIVALLVART